MHIVSRLGPNLDWWVVGINAILVVSQHSQCAASSRIHSLWFWKFRSLFNIGECRFQGFACAVSLYGVIVRFAHRLMGPLRSIGGKSYVETFTKILCLATTQSAQSIYSRCCENTSNDIRWLRNVSTWLETFLRRKRRCQAMKAVELGVNPIRTPLTPYRTNVKRMSSCLMPLRRKNREFHDAQRIWAELRMLSKLKSNLMWVFASCELSLSPNEFRTTHIKMRSELQTCVHIAMAKKSHVSQCMHTPNVDGLVPIHEGVCIGCHEWFIFPALSWTHHNESTANSLK